MKVSELIETRIIKKIPIIYKVLELQDGSKVMGMKDLRNKKTYVVNASIKDFDRFKKWEGIRTDVDLQKTDSFSIDTEDNKLANMNIKTQFGNNTGDEEL